MTGLRFASFVVAALFIRNVLWLCTRRQAKPKSSAAACQALEANRAFMGFGNRTAGSETQSGAMVLGREERAEQLVPSLLGNAHAIIVNRDLNAVSVSSDFDTDAWRLVVLSLCFQGILH